MRLAMFWKALTGEEVSGALQSLASSGGFTVAVHDDTVPTAGFMVSLPGYEEIVGSAGGVTAEMVRNYADRHDAILKPSNRFLGGWIDEGKVYFDVSEHVPDLERAKEMGTERNQVAIYDLGANETIYLGESTDREAAGTRFSKSATVLRFFIGIDTTTDIDCDGIADWIELLLKGTLEGGLGCNCRVGKDFKPGSEFPVHEAGHTPSATEES